MANGDFEERIAGVASLAEPQRLALYQFVVDRGDASPRRVQRGGRARPGRGRRTRREIPGWA